MKSRLCAVLLVVFLAGIAAWAQAYLNGLGVATDQ